MDFITTLWMPILLSAVFVFIASSIIHMFLGYHSGDYQALPDEDRKMDALRELNIAPGHYSLPKAGSMKEFSSDSFQAKMKKGPVMFLHVRQPGGGMSKNLVQWFIYCIVVSFFAAYIGSHTIEAGAEYLVVHRVVGAAAFMGYGLGIFQDAIWDGRGWRSAWVGAFDALVFAFVTGGTFGWLWPS